jgi:NAD(P)-dependent dehydrogenase (short-subunit alcohol dehydrogenase family)
MTIAFDGQVAIVTGAGRGLGRAYALDLARRGARVVVNDAGLDLHGGVADGPAPAEQVVAEIVAMGGEAMANGCDISNAVAVQAMIDQAVDRWGRVDIVVNNAGNMRKLVFSQTSEADLRSHLEVHVVGSFLVSKAAWPHMIRQGGGRIVLTTSQVGMYGQMDAAAYGAAKMAIIGLMNGMKLEADTVNIRVNAIAPFALTRMGEGAFPEAMRPYIDPACVAPAVTWLASDRCMLQGEILIAGGGHFAIARILESLGVDIDDPSKLSAEVIDAGIAGIADLTNAPHYYDALSAVGKTFSRLDALAQHAAGA